MVNFFVSCRFKNRMLKAKEKLYMHYITVFAKASQIGKLLVLCNLNIDYRLYNCPRNLSQLQTASNSLLLTTLLVPIKF